MRFNRRGNLGAALLLLSMALAMGGGSGCEECLDGGDTCSSAEDCCSEYCVPYVGYSYCAVLDGERARLNGDPPPTGPWPNARGDEERSSSR